MNDLSKSSGSTADWAQLDKDGGVTEPSPIAKLRRRIFGHHSFMIGAVVLLLMIGVALCAPLIAPHDPYEQELSSRLTNPFWHDKKTDERFVLGTDKLGRDYLSRLIYGAQISLDK